MIWRKVYPWDIIFFEFDKTMGNLLISAGVFYLAGVFSLIGSAFKSSKITLCAHMFFTGVGIILFIAGESKYFHSYRSYYEDGVDDAEIPAMVFMVSSFLSPFEKQKI